ncbi:hypothetical protein GEMRC1_009192 [Eukaryota sp. GEM-RC1]
MPFSFDILLTGVDLRLLRTTASEDTKVRAVYTHLFLGETQQSVSKFFHCHQSTLSRWTGIYFKKLDSAQDEVAVSPSSSVSHPLPGTIESYVLNLVEQDPLLFCGKSKVSYVFHLTDVAFVLRLSIKYS